MPSSTQRFSGENLAFASFVSGAYASAAVALLFLFIDGARGNPLFTPSVLGSAVILGDAPSATSAVRLDMVALYSLLHFAAFAAIGVISTLLYLRLDALRSHPALLGALLFAVLGLGAVTVDATLIPGLLAAVGSFWMFTANATAAFVMSFAIHRSFASSDLLVSSTSSRS